MPSKTSRLESTQEQAIADFFRRSEGKWYSERRYYTLPDGPIAEMVSDISVRFLEPGSEELVKLAELHGSSDPHALICGTFVRWESSNSVSNRKQSRGSSIFGAAGDTLYRDRAFVTPKPITARFYLPNPQTLCLRTEYNGSVFEEELKLIGDRYRTRQTIISRAGEQQTIGQYLEKRVG
jgi:hypothetical protein